MGDLNPRSQDLGRISHGCVRMENRNILRLAKLIEVGTPLSVR